MLHPRLAMLLVVVTIMAVTVKPAVAVAECTRSSGHHPPLLDCTPAPTPSKNDNSTFCANLAWALATLPSTAVAMSQGSATVQFAGAGLDYAFVRGLCFGANRSFPATVGACLACLSIATRDVSGGCGGYWRAGCFLSYADANASSAREEAFHGWFYPSPNTTATLAGGGCMGDHTAAQRARCFKDSARAALAGWLQRIRGNKVVVLGYTCRLRVQISVLPHGPNHFDI